MLDSIGSNTDSASEFRELTAQEVAEESSFSDYFRFSFTLRVDRDTAFMLARKVEEFISSVEDTHCVRVYLGVKNPNVEHETRTHPH